jgi:elongation factor P--beta-lysine ligase
MKLPGKNQICTLRWFADNMWTFVPAQTITAEFLTTFKEYPPVQGSSLGIDQVLKKLTTAPATGQ